MKTIWATGSTVTLAVACLLTPAAHAQSTKCELKFDLRGWSVFYKSATGTGTITCDNGQTARVTIRTKGGGLTVGTSQILNGRGSFTDVGSIDELFGTYASAEAGAGAVNAAEARVVTKGTVSLALSGTGTGFDVGISFGKFVIAKRK
jgi:hypothetical protein